MAPAHSEKCNMKGRAYRINVKDCTQSHMILEGKIGHPLDDRVMYDGDSDGSYNLYGATEFC